MLDHLGPVRLPKTPGFPKDVIQEKERFIKCFYWDAHLTYITGDKEMMAAAINMLKEL